MSTATLGAKTQDLDSGKVVITSQNHGFAVDADTLPANWNSKTKQLALVFDDKSTSAEKVQKAIAAVGYDAGDVKASKAAYDKLPGCCKYQK